ncbi:PhzF family phenazine biosynthesis protein [Leptospira congkakensis]|uniref:PhzF family phenazine biosynthesis protein n=1 Tax=Leptospira congkakensis TaxID=2484932 RepID=A0A4Z1ADJ2_9LEPT|nr:PhzF family phenazine biosynthesis protein [Leptospira congkakensis]TGL90719.1 PhzF family phenazine biosynthesis protein [Leptospira congkakensis]TGL91726.1 PhzF family phenazine biosynthesis protein [Leptospira congkakensis]TGL98780.1 PhzF family phenazine biosynthesis protein [Leptospira congkakensis]
MFETIYIIDAFTNKLFSGNPAAVLVLTHWPKEEWMQKIAMENNLSETAFVVKEGNRYRIRWFTPTVEVDLCGHATLASAFVLKNYYGESRTTFEFISKSGVLPISIEGNTIYLNFPTYPEFSQNKGVPPNMMIPILGREPKEIWKGKDTIFLYSSLSDLETLTPDFQKLSEIPTNRGYIALWINHFGNGNADYEFRFFGPGMGIPEDPATGSAHCSLAPFVSERLKKQNFKSIQKSQRGAEFYIECQGDRVSIGGSSVLYLRGEVAKAPS